jgi:hypothetical protein
LEAAEGTPLLSANGAANVYQQMLQWANAPTIAGWMYGGGPDLSEQAELSALAKGGAPNAAPTEVRLRSNGAILTA